VHFVPCSKTLNATNIAELYCKKVVKLYGISKKNIFISRIQVHESFSTHFGGDLELIQFSTICHPQTDGKTEVINRSSGSLLRSLVKKNI